MVLIVAAIAACISAVASAVSAGVNLYATRTYLKNLANQRDDDCLSNAHEVKGLIEKTIENKYAKDIRKRQVSDAQLWAIYTEAWESWRSFNKSFVVLNRYKNNLDSTLPEEFTPILRRMRDILESPWPDQPQADQARTDIQNQLRTLTERLKTAVGKPD